VCRSASRFNIANSVIEFNEGLDSGGGILNLGFSGLVTGTVVISTLYSNTSEFLGGGLYRSGEAHLWQVVVRENYAEGHGGGIDSDNA